MRDFEDFLPHIMPFVPGCPEPTAIHWLRQATIEFCERTRMWRCDDEFPVTPAECDVVCAPAGAQLLEIEHATFNDFPIDPASIDELDRDYPQWRSDTASCSQPSCFTQIAPDTVRVVPAATGTLKLYTILMPAQDGEQVPDWFYDKYAKLLAAGALKDIMMLPGEPFYNPQQAAVNSATFYSVLDTKASTRIRGQQRAAVRTRAQYL